jgi:cleavage and polyadenylation specificity factor subunit 5
LISSPGDYLKPGEDELEGIKRRLDDRLAPPTDSRQFNASHGIDNDWEIGECLAQWWRPNFETFMVRNVRIFHGSGIERDRPFAGA